MDRFGQAGINVFPARPTAAPLRGTPWLWGVACAVYAAAIIAVSWVGFLETDDLAYAQAAEGWLSSAPFLGQSHWALRHLIVLPLAASFRVFGRSEASLAAPMLAYGFGLLLLTGLCVRRVAGPVAGALAALLVASMPAFAFGATTIYTDVPEAFFVTASLWTFHFATASRRRDGFVLAGVLAGCACLTRETAVGLLILYAVLFVAGHGRRGDYVWMGVGFLAPVAADTAYLWLMSGDPLWRVHIAQRAVAGDSPYTPGLRTPAGSDDPLGVFSRPRPVQALVVLFASPAIGLLPWFGVPAGACVAWSEFKAGTRGAGWLFALLALFWFAAVSFVMLSLWLLPRYQIVAVAALAVPSALVLAGWVERGHGMRAAAVLLPVLAGGLVLAAAADGGLMFGERALAALMRGVDEPVRTDPATLRGAGWLLETAGAGGRVSAGLPVPGGLFFVNHAPRRRLPDDWPVRDVPPGSTVVASFVQEPGAVARVAARLGLARVLPPALWRKIQPPPRRAEMVRMPAAPN